jgi:Tol biopolymer transport system component
VCGGVLVLAGGLAGWWLLKPRPETRAVTLVPVPLTAAPGWETYPNLSPDGNQVAYAWREGRNSVAHIYVKLIGEGKPVRLTSSARSDDSPVWSPDGRSIAFLRDSDSTSAIYNSPGLGGTERQGTSVIYIIPALGGAERQIMEALFIPRMAWSPDGRFLAAAERQPQSESSSVSLIPVESGDRLVLTKPQNAKTRDLDPVFSPDGRLLLFTRTTLSYRGGLYLLDLAAGYRPSVNPTLLRQESSDIGGAAWTSNGNEVVYALSENSSDHRLMRIRAKAGSQPERLTFTGEHTFWPTIARRGNRLVYMQVLDDIDIWQVHPGETPRSFISSTRWEDAPQYSPDGKRVAFGSDRSGLRQVWACDADGGNQVQLTRFDRGPSGSPRWSPDGRWIAFDHEEEEGWRIYVMASDGGQVRRLEQDEDGSIIPSWSGDGKWIYYTNSQTGRLEIWKRALQGGQAMQVTHNGGWVAFES